jgi:hypothetical protein
MFRHADPTRRLPVYLQPYTAENLVWQLKLTAVLMAGILVYEVVQDRRRQNRYANLEEND